MSSELIAMALAYRGKDNLVINTIKATHKSLVQRLNSVVMMTKGRRGVITPYSGQELASTQKINVTQNSQQLGELLPRAPTKCEIDAITGRRMKNQSVRGITSNMEGEASIPSFPNRENSIYDPNVLRTILNLLNCWARIERVVHRKFRSYFQLVHVLTHPIKREAARR